MILHWQVVYIIKETQLVELRVDLNNSCHAISLSRVASWYTLDQLIIREREPNISISSKFPDLEDRVIMSTVLNFHDTPPSFYDIFE